MEIVIFILNGSKINYNLHKKETMSTVTFDFEIHPCLFQKTNKQKRMTQTFQ